ncbi:uncharacterized protein LOC110453424 [Mizuhopecten yessoensis]|uniref:uncharacterized protein LOC110453424 n=1 Tax=Mizuhopecten yessoensis TaxID=6573 RepID=UPI000B45BC88|nr:uncharacterized protein LOC110453424 [Mizuhopecten yessoensis]
MECQKHRDSKVVMICTTCNNVFVCLECATNDHKGHTFGKFDEVGKDIRKKCSNFTNVIRELRSDLQSIIYAKKDQLRCARTAATKIKQQRDAMHKAIDEISVYVMNICEKQKLRNLALLKEHESAVSEQLVQVEAEDEKLKRIVTSKNDIDLIRGSQNLKSSYTRRKSRHIPKPLEFYTGTMDASVLQQMLGSLVTDPVDTLIVPWHDIPASVRTHENDDMSTVHSKFPPIEQNGVHHENDRTPSSPVSTISINKKKAIAVLSTFKHSASMGISSVCTANPGHAWVKCAGQNEIRLTDKAGYIKRILRFGTLIRGLAVTADMRILVCCFDARCVKKLSPPSYKATATYSTGNLKPNYVCSTLKGDFLLTLVDRMHHDVSHESQRILARYTESGKEVARAQFDKFGDNLFVLPGQVRLTTNGNVVAVVNETSEESAHLVLLDGSFKLKLCFFGDGRSIPGEKKHSLHRRQKKFYINDIDFDSFDNIVFAESHTRTVQILDPSCQLLQVILQEIHIPWSVAVSELGDIWVGLDDGRVKVLK